MYKLKNKKAASSMVLILIVIIAISFATVFIDMMSYTYAVKNAQTTMDQTAVASLTIPGAITHNKFLEEEFTVNKILIENYYRNEMQNLMTQIGPRITNFEIKDVKVHAVNRHDENRGDWGFPDYMQRDYVVIESVVSITLRESGILKLPKEIKRDFFDSFSYKNLKVSETTSSGQTKIILRTMAKGTFY